jgi:hypothetical protein
MNINKIVWIIQQIELNISDLAVVYFPENVPSVLPVRLEIEKNIKCHVFKGKR